MNADFFPDDKHAPREYSHSGGERIAPSEENARETSSAPENAPCVLAIAGLDPSGGAGLFADARAMRSFGAHCCGVASAIVPQNTRGASRCDAVTAEVVAAQIDELLSDIPLRAVKIGLLPNATIAGLVASRVLAWREKNAGSVVLDPVFAPSSGARFCDAATIQVIARRLFPLCDLVTPNLHEAATLCGIEKISDETAMRHAARRIASAFGAPRVLVKGGHLSGDALDVFFEAASESCETFRAPRIAGKEVRGTGCLLASAIAAQLAQNVEMQVAIRNAKTWIGAQIESAPSVGGGRRIAI